MFFNFVTYSIQVVILSPLAALFYLYAQFLVLFFVDVESFITLRVSIRFHVPSEIHDLVGCLLRTFPTCVATSSNDV